MFGLVKFPKLIALFVIASALFSSTAAASNYNIEFSQIESKLLVDYRIVLDSEETITIKIPEDATSISANKNYSLDNNLLTIKGRLINLSYTTSDALQKSDEGYYFVDKIDFALDFGEASIKLILDEGYFIDKERVFPEPARITSDGRQIILEWNVINAKQGDDFPLFIIIQQTQSSQLSTILLGALIIIILAAAGYFAYAKYGKKAKPRIIIKTKKPGKKSDKFEDAEKYLVESEKAVLSSLKKADRGELWQKQIQTATNFSKAKLSRIIRNLESRNLIEKIPFGNTNKVRLK